MSYVLQIIHKTNEIEQPNVMEIQFTERYQAEAEQRRHNKMKHNARCESYILDASVMIHAAN